MGGAERVEPVGEFLPPTGARPCFRPLAKIAELLGADRSGQTFELVQDLTGIVASRLAKRLQPLDKSPAIIYGLENEGA